MSSDTTKLFLLLFLPALLFSACSRDNTLNGNWARPADQPEHEALNIDRISFRGATARVIDGNRIGLEMGFILEEEQLRLFSEEGEQVFPVQLMDDTTLKISRTLFYKTRNAGERPLDLPDRPGSERFSTEGPSVRNLSVYQNAEGKLLVRSAGTFPSLRDLPLAISCTHCTAPETIRLFADRNLPLPDVLEVLFLIGSAGVQKVQMITRKKNGQEYEGYVERIDLWQEEVDRLVEKYKILPPPKQTSIREFISQEKAGVKVRLLPGYRLEKEDGQTIPPDGLGSLLEQSSAPGLILLSRGLTFSEYVDLQLALAAHQAAIQEKEAQRRYNLKFGDLSDREKAMIRRDLVLAVVVREALLN